MGARRPPPRSHRLTGVDGRTLRIALVSPHAFPPGDDLGRAVAAEAEALSRRGHAVTILAPARGRVAAEHGRRLIDALQAGEHDAIAAQPAGPPLVVATGRAIRSASGRGLSGPIDPVSGIDAAIRLGGFDVVHLHEPLAPSPALAALRHAPGVRAVTFHRTAPLAGVAFVRPLVDRALSQADIRIAGSDAARHVLQGVLPGDYVVVRPGVDADLFGPPPDHPGVVVIARERDRTGLRFALRALVGADPTLIGRITVLGPPDAPWRTRAAVPKALRDLVDVVPDTGPASRADALRRGCIALLSSPEDAGGASLREAMAAGLAIIAPRCPEVDESFTGDTGVALPPFSADAWSEAVRTLAADPARVRDLGARAAARVGARTWDDDAADLERLYLMASVRSGDTHPPTPLFADLHVRTGPFLGPDQVVTAARQRDVGVVAVAAPGGIEPALAVLRAAPETLRVIVGQEIATREGVIVGLFLTTSVPNGLPLADALACVREQGGVTMAPHPDLGSSPPPDSLRACRDLIDCHEGLVPLRPAASAVESALLLQRAGLVVSGGSAAVRPEEVGTAGVIMRDFTGPQDFLAALGDARPVRRRRGMRVRPPRSARRITRPR